MTPPRIPPRYIPASWRDMTVLDPDARCAGIGFTTEQGDVFVQLDEVNLRLLRDAISDSVDGLDRTEPQGGATITLNGLPSLEAERSDAEPKPAPATEAAHPLANLRTNLVAVWPDGWNAAWGPTPRPEDLRKLLGDSHPWAPPAVYQGMTGIGSDGPVCRLPFYRLTIMTFDEREHDFVLSRVDLCRIADDVATRHPGWIAAHVTAAVDQMVSDGTLHWTADDQPSGPQSDARRGNLSSADTDCSGSARDANNASRAP